MCSGVPQTIRKNKQHEYWHKKYMFPHFSNRKYSVKIKASTFLPREEDREHWQAFLLNKRWFQAQVRSLGASISSLQTSGWAVLHRAPLLAGPPSGGEEHQLTLLPPCRPPEPPQLISLLLYFTCSLPTKRKRAYQPSNCMKAHPERASQLLISSQPGWGLISTPKHYINQQRRAAEQFCTARIIWVFFSLFCCKTRFMCRPMQTEKMLMSKGLSLPGFCVLE